MSLTENPDLIQELITTHKSAIFCKKEDVPNQISKILEDMIVKAKIEKNEILSQFTTEEIEEEIKKRQIVQ